MKFTALANKKICLLFPGEHERRENIFLFRILLLGSPNLVWKHGLHLLDIPVFAERCILFRVRILGFEISPDSPFPLYETCFEDFSKEYDPNWYWKAMEMYNKLGIMEMIRPVIDVEKETLNEHLV